MNIAREKICSVCGSLKPLCEFYRQRDGKFGRFAHCKKCHGKQTRAWREANPEKCSSYQRKYQENNPQQRRETNQRWYKNNLESARASRRSHYDANKLKSKESHKRWKRNNRQRVALYEQNRRSRKRGAGYVSIEEWEDILIHYEYRCLKCGTQEGITMDHVIPLSGGGLHIASNLQPLCFSCNSSKNKKIVDYRKAGGPK